MKRTMAVLAATSFLAGPSPGGEAPRLRYHDVSSPMSVTVHQDIDVGEMKSIASRDFSFDLDLVADPADGTVTVTIGRARASYVAHGQRQRLATRHLKDASFPMRVGEEGRRLEPGEAADATVVELGPFPAVGLSVAGALADSLPVLPSGTVSVGSTWETERPLRTLEGWGWSEGQLTSRHRVTAVEEEDGHTLIRVSTQAEAGLRLIENPEHRGSLQRSVLWVFDATDGRLRSASIEQETEGASLLPQGVVRHHQRTRIELGPRS